MPAWGQEDGGSVGATGQEVMSWTGGRTARRGAGKDDTAPGAPGGRAEGCALEATVAPQGKGRVESPDLSCAGKPDAVQAACPVWTGGKAVRPYLAVQVSASVRHLIV